MAKILTNYSISTTEIVITLYKGRLEVFLALPGGVLRAFWIYFIVITRIASAIYVYYYKRKRGRLHVRKGNTPIFDIMKF